MKHRWIALLLALLCACSARAETPAPAPAEPPVSAEKPAKQESSKNEKPSTEAPAPTVTESSQSKPSSPDREEQKPAGDPDAHVTVNGTTTKMLTNGDTSACLELTDDAVITISWPENRSFDRVLFEGMDLHGTFTIYNENTVLYSQELSNNSRWCYIGEQNASELIITMPKGNSISEITITAPAEDRKSLLCAYLPYSSFTDDMLTDGSLAALDELTVNVGCYWTAEGSLDVKNGLTSVLSEIRTAYPELKLICTINPKAGGAAAILSVEKRDILIQNMLTFCRDNKLNGVDIDWEFPAEDQWDEFNALLSGLGHELDDAGMSLSAAFYPNQAELDSNALLALDTINIMAYDQFDENGFHSTYLTAEEAIDAFLDLGAEPQQLCLGIPAYGRPVTEEAVWPFYRDYAAAIEENGDLLNGSYFNSPQLAQDKAVLARQKGLRGVFLYHLGCDLPGNDDRSLSASIKETLK